MKLYMSFFDLVFIKYEFYSNFEFGYFKVVNCGISQGIVVMK